LDSTDLFIDSFPMISSQGQGKESTARMLSDPTMIEMVFHFHHGGWTLTAIYSINVARIARQP